ncbi:MAG: hypothetical protein NWF02_07730 [Candidatus Bathyarchaeota archaeon]|nr:hypothetical protein [Candidatus Bathyarchaeum sp.]
MRDIKPRGHRKALNSEEFKRTQRVFEGIDFEHGRYGVNDFSTNSYLFNLDRKVAADLGRKRGYTK